MPVVLLQEAQYRGGARRGKLALNNPLGSGWGVVESIWLTKRGLISCLLSQRAPGIDTQIRERAGIRGPTGCVVESVGASCGARRLVVRAESTGS